MARALARGWGDPVLATDAGSGRRGGARRGARRRGGRSNAELAERADVVVLCHKPAQLDEVAARGRRPGAGRGLGAGRRDRSPTSRGLPATRRSSGSCPTRPSRSARACSCSPRPPTPTRRCEPRSSTCSSALGAVVGVAEEQLMDVGDGADGLRPGLPRAGRRGAGRRRDRARDGRRTPRRAWWSRPWPAPRRCCAPATTTRRGAPRGHLARGVRPHADWRRWRRRACARRCTRRHGRRGGAASSVTVLAAIDRVDRGRLRRHALVIGLLAADLRLRARVLIFSLGVRVPYSRWSDAVLDFLRDVSEPYLRIFRPLHPDDRARSTSARSSAMHRAPDRRRASSSRLIHG